VKRGLKAEKEGAGVKRKWDVMRITERDLKILDDLYERRTMTVKQIRQLHFVGTEKYVYHRLYQLKKCGYVKSMPMVKDGQKTAACYYVTEQGVRLLKESGRIKTLRRARNNKASGKKIKYVIDTNNLYTTLKGSGWEVVDSRRWKNEKRIDRNTMLRCGLRRKDGKEYNVYIVGAEITDRTLKKIQNEIEKQTLQDIILYKGKGQEQTKEIMKRLRGMMSEIAIKEINLMPFMAGLRILLKFTSEESCKELFKQYGEVLPYSGTYMFANYLIRKHEQEYYLCNHLYGNETAIHWLKRYAVDRYKQDGRKVLLFTWSSYAGMLRQEFEQYPHIEVVGLDTRMLSDEEIDIQLV
jgi:hypothetical protein